jgi:F5/8 type C domain-containing protein
MSRARPWLLAATAYIAATLVLCHAIVARPGRVLPADLGDPVLNTWILWWNAHAVPLTATWWNAPIFFPVKGALAFSETLLGIVMFTTPLQWIGLSPVATYNVAFVASFPLCALSMHVLAWRLTGRHDAAFVAGLIYGFNPYRIAHAPQLQVLSSYWLPLALAGLHAFVESGRRSALAAFAAFWFLQAQVSGYLLLYSTILIGLWILWFVRVPRALAAIAAAWAIAGVACLPVLLQYRRVHTALSLRRGFGEIESFGADASALLAGTHHLVGWGRFLLRPRPEGELFFGFGAIVLVTVAVVRSLRRPIGTMAALLFAVSAVVAAVGLTAFWSGGFEVGTGALRLTVNRPFKSISLSVWLAVVGTLVSVPFRSAIRRRSAFGFYVVATVALVILSFGPTPRVFGHRFLYQAPYRWLLVLPGFDGLRVPSRFGAVATVSVAAAAALAFARLRTARPMVQAVVTAAVVAAIALDSAADVPAIAVPHSDSRPIVGEGAVLELPLGDVFADARAMYRAMTHGRPLVNGYSGYAPVYYEPLAIGIRERDPRTLDVLRRYAPITVVIRDDSGGGAEYRSLVTSMGGRVIEEGDGVPALTLDRVSAPSVSCGGHAIPIAAVDGSGEDPAAALDGNLETGWHSADVQKGGERIVIDLGSPHLIETVTLAQGAFWRDFPRRLRVELSDDHSAWTEAWTGSVVSYVVEGGIVDPRAVPVRLPLAGAKPSRWVALTQLGEAPDAVWSVAELEVCGR